MLYVDYSRGFIVGITFQNSKKADIDIALCVFCLEYPYILCFFQLRCLPSKSRLLLRNNCFFGTNFGTARIMQV